MSICYDIVCDQCRTRYWLGQRSGIYNPDVLLTFLHEHIGHELRVLIDPGADEKSFGYTEWREPAEEKPSERSLDVEAERVKFEAKMADGFEEPDLSRRGDGYHDQTMSMYWHAWLLRAEAG